MGSLALFLILNWENPSGVKFAKPFLTIKPVKKMLHNSPLPYHTKAGLEILLNFIFHFSTRSEYANSLFCDLLHRHKSSCCLLESFNFGFLLKAFLQGGCLTGTKILQAAEDNLNCCEHRILASPQHRQLFLYCSLPCIFCFIQNETTEQALVGHEG